MAAGLLRPALPPAARLQTAVSAPPPRRVSRRPQERQRRRDPLAAETARAENAKRWDSLPRGRRAARGRSPLPVVGDIGAITPDSSLEDRIAAVGKIKVPFGANKGMAMKDVPVPYLRWMADNLEGGTMEDFAGYAKFLLEDPALKEREEIEARADDLLRRSGYDVDADRKPLPSSKFRRARRL